MSKPLILVAASLTLALPLSAHAKSAKPSAADPAATAAAPTADAPAASTPDTTAATTASPSAATGGSADASATAPAFAVGVPVKDNTGAVIGTISELKPGATGAQMATIKMGSDQFAVATTGLAMQDGAAVINMTQAELQAKLHPDGAK